MDCTPRASSFFEYQECRNPPILSNERAVITTALLNECGLNTRTTLGLSRTNAATMLGAPPDHNRMVVITSSDGVR